MESTNPVTGAAITTDANAAYALRQEPDPLGRDLAEALPNTPVNPLGSVYLKDRAMPIEYTGGPSNEFGIPDWYVNMAMAGWDAHLAENMFSIGRRDLAEAILARNPNVGLAVIITGFGLEKPKIGAVWGDAAAGYLEMVGQLMDAGQLELVSGPSGQSYAHSPQNAPLDVDKPYTKEFPCNRSANDLFRTLRRDFSKFANFVETVGDGAAIASINFERGPITQGRRIGITTGAMSTTAIPGSESFPYYARSFSVTVKSASTQSFTFETNPGHVFYPGTITFSAKDIGSGRVSASVTAKGYFADREARALFNAGGGRFENDVWNNFLNNLQKSCAGQRIK